MARKKHQSDDLRLRSIGEKEIAMVHQQQNGACRRELSDFFDFDPLWAPMTIEQVKAKITDFSKPDRKVLLGIFSKDNKFIGLGLFGGDWDPWSPFIHLIIWPEYRRKGFGSDAARLLLRLSFDNSLAHVVGCFSPEWNKVSISFIEALGFKRAGVMRRIGLLEDKFFDGFFYDMLREEYNQKWGDF